MLGIATLLLLSGVMAPQGASAKEAALEAPKEFQALSPMELRKLGQGLCRKLHRCKELRKRTDLSVRIRNNTPQAIDATILEQVLGENFGFADKNRAPSYEIRITLSRVPGKEKADAAVFVLKGELVQSEEKLCEATKILVKNPNALPF